VAYQVIVDETLPETLEAIRSYPARETCTALEIADGPVAGRNTIAAACAFLTERAPDGGQPVPGLIAQRGNQLPALVSLDLLSTQRLDGHTDAPDGVLAGLDCPPRGRGHRATERGR